MDTSPNPKIMKMRTFRGFPKWSRKVTSPKWSRIIRRSFRATLFLKFTIKMVPPPCSETPDPEFPSFFVNLLQAFRRISYWKAWKVEQLPVISHGLATTSARSQEWPAATGGHKHDCYKDPQEVLLLPKKNSDRFPRNRDGHQWQFVGIELPWL